MSDHTSPQQSAGSRGAGTSRPAAAGTAASEPATPHSTTYKAVPPQVDLPAMEHQIIDLWDRNHTFEKSLEHTKDGEPW
ncbi:MAG: hypothetical protein L0L18_07310, partial [Acidipropionibacterium jensenii]|nr:hypothetical protein [Acidipropionibacterium jensenii]